MGIIIEPNLEFDKIEIPIHDKVEEVAEVGRNFPIVKINGIVIPQQNIVKLNVRISLYTLPTFSLTIYDLGENVEKTLNNFEYDKITIFLGHKDIHLKFDGHITTVTGKGRTVINGIMCQPNMFESEQKLYKEKSITDICKEFCEQSKYGLFVFENSKIQNPVDVIINPGWKKFAFIDWLIRNYTDNLYSFDTFGYLHLGDMKSILSGKIDTYTFHTLLGKELKSPQEIIFTNNHEEDKAPEDQVKLYFDSYSIQTSFGHTLFESPKQMFVNTEKEEKEYESNNEIGGYELHENVWSGFEKHKFPSYSTIINKQIFGNVITVEIKNPCYEIVPFALVKLELYQNINNVDEEKQKNNNQVVLDLGHSGKHMVVGYSYRYDINNENQVRQTIEMI